MKPGQIAIVFGVGVLIIVGVYFLTRPEQSASQQGGAGLAPGGQSGQGQAIGTGLGAALGGLIGLGIEEATRDDESRDAQNGAESG